ncbi:EAL domain-containing protein [Salmonella enterica]
MTSRRLVSLITGGLVLAFCVPVGLSILFTHRQASEAFMQELNMYADLAELRKERVVKQSKTAIQELDSYHGIPCTEPHMEEMHRVSYSARYVREVFYTNGLQPLCSSLKGDSHTPPLPQPENTTPDGFHTWLIRYNDGRSSHEMIALGSDRHVVLTDPQSFIDLLSFGAWPANVALISTKSHQIIAGNTTLAPEMLAHISQTGPQNMQVGDLAYAIRRDAEMDLAVVAWASVTPLAQNWHRLLLIWLPFSLLMSLVASFILLRLLRRLQSLRYLLQEAIRNRKISVYYQPIVELKSGRIVGGEALARWRQQDGNFVPPDVFIPLAERSGLMPQLTALVIETVFDDMGSWLQKHPEHHISINLEPSDLLNPGLPALLSRLLNRWHITPSQISLELTERGFADPTVSVPAINTLRKAGHAIYIDDFGSGYSSLSYLQNLDVDLIKIDRSFVDALEYKTVTPHIVEMAKALRLSMVAEGIETEGQLEWLKRYGVQYGQGWLYSKALPAEEFIQWAENNLRDFATVKVG